MASISLNLDTEQEEKMEFLMKYYKIKSKTQILQDFVKFEIDRNFEVAQEELELSKKNKKKVETKEEEIKEKGGVEDGRDSSSTKSC